MRWRCDAEEVQGFVIKCLVNHNQLYTRASDIEKQAEQ